MRDLLEAIKQRGPSLTPFGHGIMTADRHVKNMQDLAGLDLCYRYASTQRMSFADAMKRASNTLVYSNEDMVIEEKAAGDTKLENIELPKNTLVVFKHVLTTPRKDRDGDVLRTEGAIVDPKMLLLWQHVHTLPIGKMLAVVEHNTKRLVLLSCIVDMNELAHDAAVMVDADMARFSHGFRALEFQELKETEGETTGYGFDVKRFEIMEESIVSVPSNADAEVQDVMLALVEGGKLKSPIMKEYGKTIRQQMPLLVAPGISLKQVEENKSEEPTETTSELTAPEEAEAAPSEEAGKEAAGAEVPEVVVETTANLETQETIEPKSTSGSRPRSKRTISCGVKSFDVELEHLEASKLEYEWVSRWVDCQIKELQVISTFVPQYRKGSFLTGLQQQQSGWVLRDTRNLTSQGKEEPPCFSVVQLNSRLSNTFLTEGIQFFQTPQGKKVAVKIKSSYGGVSITTYEKIGESIGTDVIDKSWQFSRDNNFLKGEAFSLAGDFITRESTQWDEVFLEDTNKQALQRTVRLLNEQQSKMPNRGLIVMGPPGTGKTLSGRVVLNESKATFIWVAAKDFWKMGAVDGLCAAFELAKELAPAVIFMEDVDNWISSYAVDVIKGEMDGIGKTTGITTILTTNFPDRFPDALIDRPGRFHDVLMFDLPSERVRREMLVKWTGCQIKSTTLDQVVKDTDGYSGAHIYELVYFAKTLQTEDAAMDFDTALIKAISKIDAQRSLLDQSQLAGSHFRDSKDCPLKVKQYMASLGPLALTKTKDEKAGRALSAANAKAIQACMDDLQSIIDTDKDMSRGSQAICERCVGRLQKVIDSVSTDEGKEVTTPSVKDAIALVLSAGSESDHSMLLSVLKTLEAAKAKESFVNDFMTVVGQ